MRRKQKIPLQIEVQYKKVEININRKVGGTVI